MDDREMRDQLAALESQNTKLKDRIAGLEAENAAPATEPATEVVMVRTGGCTRTILVGVLVFLTCLAVAVIGVAIWTHYTVLDTMPLISQALVWIDGKLPGALGGKFSPPVIAPGTPSATAIQQVSTWVGRPLPADLGQIRLLKSDSLGPAQKAVRWFDTLVWVIPIVALLLAAVTVWLSRRRRLTLIELGIGVAVALVLTRVIVKQASSALLSDLHQGSGLSVVRDVVHAALSPLTTITIWIVVIGVLVAFSAWIAGRRDVQIAVVSASRRVVKRQSATMTAGSPATEWIERHLQLLRWAGLVAGLILLVFAVSSWLGIISMILLTLIYEGVLSLIVREWPFGHHARDESASG